MFKKKLFLLSAIFIILFTVETIAQEEAYKPFAQVMPEPKGGMESIYKYISYPEIAARSGIEGKVFLLVYINEKGGVDDVKVVKGIGAGCDEAAVNGLKKVEFNPGKDDGVPIKVKMSLPVTFKLKK